MVYLLIRYNQGKLAYSSDNKNVKVNNFKIGQASVSTCNGRPSALKKAIVAKVMSQVRD